MSRLKLIIIAMLAGNILLLGLEASKPPKPIAPETNQPQQRADVPTIRLISELDDPAFSGEGLQCFTVGPFESQQIADAITGMLNEHTTQARARESRAFVDRGYWVYLPPFDDEISARNAVNALYDAGVEDVNVIRNGELDLSVSLGYFVNQDNAQRHRDSIRALGFPAEFRIQRDDETRYWVDYQQRAGTGYASIQLRDLVPEELHHAASCPSAAGQEHNPSGDS